MIHWTGAWGGPAAFPAWLFFFAANKIQFYRTTLEEKLFSYFLMQADQTCSQQSIAEGLPAIDFWQASPMNGLHIEFDQNFRHAQESEELIVVKISSFSVCKIAIRSSPHHVQIFGSWFERKKYISWLNVNPQEENANDFRERRQDRLQGREMFGPSIPHNFQHQDSTNQNCLNCSTTIEVDLLFCNL